MRACLTARQAAFTFFPVKKSKQKRPVQKKVTEWCSFAAFE
jgi:hypothetical protein